MSESNKPKPILYRKLITSAFHLKQIRDLSSDWGVDCSAVIWLVLSKGLTAEMKKREIKTPD